MKNCLILHGTDGHPKENWFDWLKIELEGEGYKVWVPQLPGCDRPSMSRYNKFLLDSDWEFNDESIIVGHSSGAVGVLGLLSELEFSINGIYLVGVFKDDLGWDVLKDLFDVDIDWEKVKGMSKDRYVIHSDNDPYVPLEQAKYVAGKIDAEFILKKGQGHFSVGSDPKYTEFPFLKELLLRS